MEIERKFIIKKLPDDLGSYPSRFIEQAYLNTDPVVRIRREDDECYLTWKGRGLMVREEQVLPQQAGIVDMALGEGEKVGVGQTVALVYRDAQTQSDQAQLEALAMEIELLTYAAARLMERAQQRGGQARTTYWTGIAALLLLAGMLYMLFKPYKEATTLTRAVKVK